MKSKFTLFILLLSVFASCKKTNNVDVTVSTSGKLSYKLLDDSGKGIPNVKVSIFDTPDNYYSNAKILLDTRLTDQNGLADFGDLNPRSYLIVLDSPMVKNIKYNIQEYVQVITGKTKEKEIKVPDYSGTMNFKVTAPYNNNQPQRNIGLLLIPAYKYGYNLTIDAYLRLAEFKGVTNDTGMISFKVPSNKDYYVLAYNITTNQVYGAGSYPPVQKDGTVNQSFYIYNL